MLRVKGKQDWETPQWLFDYLDSLWGPFDLDAAATFENSKCGLFLTKKINALKVPWMWKTFCNPPWAKPGPWVEKAWGEWSQHQHETTMLLPAIGMFSTWYRDWWGAFDTYLITPRVAFVGPGSSPNGGTMVLRFGSETTGVIRLLDLTDVRPSRKKKAA